MQILFYHFDVFLEIYIVLNVIFGQTYSDKECVIELLVYLEIISNKILPSLTANLNRNSFLKGFFKAPARGQILASSYLRKPPVDPLSEQGLICCFVEDHLVYFVFKAFTDLIGR